MRILIIEDDYITAQNLSAILASDGAILDTAELGEDGLRRAAEQVHDLIILDLSLPDMHGLSVLKTLRAANSHTPVLILSGDARFEMRSICLERGADDYLTKPFHSRELVARVHAIGRRVGGHAKLMGEAKEATAQMMLLTVRERDVLNQIAVGHSNKAVALLLGLSPRTVEVHRARLMKKLHASSFADVVRIQSAAARNAGTLLSA
jgi:DNA-binding NarL/FixJ family response regulator